MARLKSVVLEENLMKPHLTWPQLLFIQCGGALCLPVFAIGAELRLTVGILPAVLAIVAGNFLLLIVARPIVLYATQCRQNTPQILSSFVHGGKLCAIVFMLNLVGWYGINNILLARALNSLLGTSTLLTLTSLGCLLPLIASKGPHRLAFVAKWTMPVMLVLLAFKANWRIETLTPSYVYPL